MSYLVAFDLEEDLCAGGCPMCRAMRRVSENYLATLMRSDISDARVRTSITEAEGLCREHALLAVDVAARRGTQMGLAILAQLLLEIGNRRLARAVTSTKRLSRRRRAREPARICPACAAEAVITDSYVRLLLERKEAPIRGFVSDGHHGICLPHALQAMQRTPVERERRWILGSWVRRADYLVGELHEFLRKEAFQFRDEAKGSERESAVRALQWFCGEPRHQP